MIFFLLKLLLENFRRWKCCTLLIGPRWHLDCYATVQAVMLFVWLGANRTAITWVCLQAHGKSYTKSFVSEISKSTKLFHIFALVILSETKIHILISQVQLWHNFLKNFFPQQRFCECWSSAFVYILSVKNSRISEVDRTTGKWNLQDFYFFPTLIVSKL